MIPIPPVAYVIAAALALGCVSGYEAKSILVKAEQSIMLQKEQDKLIEAREISSNLLDALEKTQAKETLVYRTIVKEMPTSVPTIQKEDSYCNLSNSTKRLLDNIINSMPKASIGPPTASAGSSDIRAVDTIDYLVRVINLYKVSRNRCNSLITWYKQTYD